MIKYTNEYGKECWKNATGDSPFSNGIFHESEYNTEDHYQVCFFSNIGNFTVLDRMTGFGYRDVETGYRDPDGNFWLASGMNDVRESGCETIGEAIQWVKNRANTCVPDVE